MIVVARGGASVPAARAAPSPAPPRVGVAAVLSRVVTDWQGYSGRLEAVDDVAVRSLVSGAIVAVQFKDGARVAKGDPLFVIDPRPYAVAVDRASAQVAAARARSTQAEMEFARAQRLIDVDAIARSDFEARANAMREADAGVKVAEATLAAAKLDLAHTRIVAPVAGRVSRAERSVGNIVSADATAPALASVVSVSPLYAAFDVDERTYLSDLNGEKSAAARVSIGLADEDGYPHPGVVASVDNRLDPGSGTIRVRARLNNPDGALVPGLFARVRVGSGKPHPAAMIDDRAIVTDQDRKFVLVVDPRDRVEYREIKPGSLQDGLRVVAEGLRPGERVVVEGVQHVRSGDAVTPHPVPMQDSSSPSPRT